MLHAKSITHQGLVREQNEDAVLDSEALGLWVVADGVGGNTSGEVASQLAVQTIERRVRQGDSLTRAIEAANRAICDSASTHDDYQSMATTVVSVLFQAGHFELAWVGDSRAYLIDNTGMFQLSSDHNVANELLEQGEIDAVDVHSHPGQHELTQALGQQDLAPVPKSIGELHDGDYLLLCTDGLSGVLEDRQIQSTIRAHQNLDTICDSLLEQVLAAGAPDNVSFSLIKFESDKPKVEASDFNAPERSSLRSPFDRGAYDLNCKDRPVLLAIILISIVLLIFFI